MEFKDAVKIVHPDKFDSWWKNIDKDKDYQAESDKLLEEKTGGKSIRSDI